MLKQKKLELEKLNKQLAYHDKLYHGYDNPEITDAQYDMLYKSKKELLEQFPELEKYDNYKNAIGSLVNTKFYKVEHLAPMLSLENAFSKTDIEKFISRTKRFLHMNNDELLTIICELKIDGLSFSMLYKDGVLTQASTRGNGYFGEDITQNIKTIKDIPHIIKNAPHLLEVRGEIYMDRHNFKQINKTCNFANPRNAAAGSVRQLNHEITKSRNLKYFVYSIVNHNINTQEELLHQLDNWGFCVNKNSYTTSNIEEALNFYEKIYNNRHNISYDIDGVIYKINNISLQKKLGITNKYPRWAIAHKFPSTEAKTQLKNISIQVGRTGVITPIAELEPINIGGVIISRANLHNQDEIIRKDIRIGDYVTVKRAGDVIPQIVDVDKSLRSKKSHKFIFPSHCPSCGCKLHKDQQAVALRCTGELTCKNQILEKMKHFVSRDALNIIGIGKKQLEFFYEQSLITSIDDIFSLEEKLNNMELENTHGWGKKSIANLLQAIRHSKNVSLENFIFALGIRFIGKNTAKALAQHYISYENWYASMLLLKDNINISGIGKKSIESLRVFFSEQQNINILSKIVQKLNIINAKNKEHSTNTSNITGKIIVFTGTFSNMSRTEAKFQAEQLGAKVQSSLSTKTNLLVVGSNPGSKYQKAKKLHIQIIDEDAWLTMIR
ncbi:NAD-dependent DNA ligase LigA [Neoehrlichia mikurensis]|uniref:DNA ligase n=1 Tax=Neoehrlichia mikurensis TaxID=89586 RepID=A0A9Q9C188_9RICK|nr:NAD-dependent DNA ligase LigA [Neoehrlichia mikurensis]QXK91710.1 NAD-dependent DNA ligase LigA [Neoehrlichia mikurensis]QXK92922.1 NAD-dependent DNA ligase LigA [Neoehrlichia mikurensis]QXK93401.1 NAD-dependent DNA ligase LigA [Neoehrlichia mikurensis]UTO55649.1 NAD-dependent DNA ligase LigA [Neoehrlichia mikurensis]UTO56570.1 NAD-dependent DNA ligase LigA [Neoehrlichia mikurensis]